MPESAGSRAGRNWWLAVVLVTAVAAVLRLVELNLVPDDLYYDAAVRSMGLSLHNFFFGAFEPGASASIDKPPIDLWLQVISVKVLGWGPVALKLPEALGGTAAVPLLYDVVRRVAGNLAALGSAITLAVLPTAVVTARSDTMDSVMMLLLVAAAWLLIRSAEQRRLRLLIAAGAVIGLAFNVKLFEAFVPLPAFALFAWLCWAREPVLLRVRRLAAAGSVLVVVALSWMVAVSIVPVSHRPWAIGSTNGSIWNSVFIFDGLDRITKPPTPRSFSTTGAGLPAPTGAGLPAAHAATVAPIAASTSKVASPAGPLRLFQYSLVGYGTRIGTVLFAAIVFGILGMVPLVRRRLRAPPDASRAQLIAWAAAIGLALWLLTGYLVFSFAGRVQPRYLEAFTPAVAAALGCGLVIAVRRARDLFGVYLLLAAFAIAMLESAAETASGKLGYLAIGIGAVLAMPVLAYVAFGFADSVRQGGRWPRWYRVEAVTLGMLAALLAFPVVRDALLIKDGSGAQAAEPTLGASIVDPISRFLLSHQGNARYEFAASAATLSSAFIVKGGRPVLLLTTVGARPLVTTAELRRAAARGEVRYVFNHGSCPAPASSHPTLPACSLAMQWVRAHARDITAEVGLTSSSGLLYDLRRPAA